MTPGVDADEHVRVGTGDGFDGRAHAVDLLAHGDLSTAAGAHSPDVDDMGTDGGCRFHGGDRFVVGGGGFVEGIGGAVDHGHDRRVSGPGVGQIESFGLRHC